MNFFLTNTRIKKDINSNIITPLSGVGWLYLGIKRYSIFLIFIMSYLLPAAQSNIRLSNYWGDMHYISPASIYDKYDAVFSMAARKQWLGVHGAPTTLFASGTTYLEKYRIQLGLSLIQDKIGYITTNNLNFSYGYAIMLKQDWQLHLGVGVNYQSLKNDFSSIRVVDMTDDIIYQGLEPRSLLNADFGSEVTNENFKIGFASQNLISLFQMNPLQTNTNFVYGKYYQNSNNIVNFGAGICGIQYADIYQMEFSVTSYFKYKDNNGLTNKSDLFDIGLFYRTQSELGLVLGINITDAIHASYSYDYHFGAIRLGSYGTNEIMITYNLNRKPKCHNCWY